MKPGLFRYVRAGSVDDAVSLMQELDGEASYLAGGQSLMPAMSLRLAFPEVVIDISALAELQAISLENGVLRIGAGCRYTDVLQSPLVAGAAPLLVQAIPFIAHEAIRNRGTLGGSLVHADPASELPACMLALAATIVLKSVEGERRVAAEDFFLGTYYTAMAEGDLLVAIEIAAIAGNATHRFDEIARRAGDYAIAGAAFAIAHDGAVITDARLAFFSVSDRAVLAKSAAQFLLGKVIDDQVVRAASQMVVDELEFFGDLYNGVAAKKQITATLTRRLLAQFSQGAR
jgi:aerobic carbon-monoxide dehydrogenase medium subunit